MQYGKLARWLISKTYTSHTRSRQIKKAIFNCMGNLKFGDMGLNVGAGESTYGPAIINLDIVPNNNIDICANAENLPFSNLSLSVVISQETLEHVRNHNKAIDEIYRVLKDGGIFYCQTPFIIGSHSLPNDFWRFTKAGIRELVENSGFQIEEIGIAVGPAMGFYRIATEFFAIIFSCYLPSIYYLVKGLIALLLYPIQWLDYFLLNYNQADRIAASFYVIAKKVVSPQANNLKGSISQLSLRAEKGHDLSGKPL